MIRLFVNMETIERIKEIDVWLGQLIKDRPSEPKPYHHGGKVISGVLSITFVYPEDEVAFKLKFRL